MNAADVEHLRELEESLWVPATRFDRAHVERVLHPEFREFGASGRTYSRAEIVATPVVEFETKLPLPDFEAHELEYGIVLVTYVSSVAFADHTVFANRTSIWIRTPDGWQLRHHQGTPAPHPEENVF